MAELRKCIGSTRFRIEAHEAPIEDFPAQPSGRDGLGRMCRTHWNQYTAGLARDAKGKKAGAAEDTDPVDPDRSETTAGNAEPAAAPTAKHGTTMVEKHAGETAPGVNRKRRTERVLVVDDPGDAG